MTEPACTKPKITDIGNLPHIPQETLILSEFVKPPGSVWVGGTTASALQAAKWPELLCTCSSPGAASLVLCVLLTMEQGGGKADASGMMRDLQFFLHEHKARQWQQDQAGRSTGSLSYEKWYDDSLLSTDKMSLLIHVRLQYQML